MIGYIRASSRFLRDRRILLGSLISVILSFISVLCLSALFGNGAYSTIESVILVFAGLLWPMLWGNIVAGILPKDEYRQGTLELLLMTPITPRKLVFAMSASPIVIATILYCAVFPVFFILFSNPMNHAMALCAFFTALIFIPISWMTIVSTLWTAASKTTDEEQTATKIFSLGSMVCASSLMIFPFWMNLSKYYFEFSFVIMALGSLILASGSVINRTDPFSLEDMDAPVDPISKRVAGLMALFRKQQETIFEREDGISKYETLERIRQQTLGGPLLLEKTIRDISFTALFLVSPFVLIIFILPGMAMSAFFCVGYVAVLFVTTFYTASTAMKEMLEERSTLRLDSIRTTLLSISDVTRAKEWTAKILPFTVLKWSLAFGGVWILLGHFSFESVIVVGLCAVQAWLALSISARLGLRLGLSARDVFEGVLWIVLIFCFWILVPYLGALFVSPDFLGGVPLVLFQFVEKASPLFIIHHLSFGTLHVSMYLQLAGAFFLQWSICFGLDCLNNRRIGAAWS